MKPLMVETRPAPPRRVHYAAVALACGLFAIYGSLLPWQFERVGVTEALSVFIDELFNADDRPSRTDFSTNVLLFVPLAFAAMGVCLLDRSGAWRTVAALIAVVVSCACLSLAVEFAQVWIPERTASRLDVLAQVLGTLVGVVAWILCGARLTAWLRSQIGENRPAGRIGLLLWMYVFGLCAYNVLPLDLTLHPVELARQFTRGRILLVPFTGYEWNLQTVWAIVFDALIFVPVGVFCTGRWSTGKVRSPLDSILLGGLIALGVECAQLFVLSRFSETTDVISGTLGVCLGVWLVRMWHPAELPGGGRPLRSLRWVALTLLCTAFACAYLWSPFEPVEDPKFIRERLSDFLRLPMQRLQTNSDFLALTQILRKFLLFVPIGGCAGMAILTSASSRSTQRALVCVCLAMLLGLALLIEFVQAALPEHVPDVTDTALYAAGGTAGVFGVYWLLGKRAAPTPTGRTSAQGDSS